MVELRTPTYLDPLAVRIQSTRRGKAREWKRFLVFAELTRSQKGGGAEVATQREYDAQVDLQHLVPVGQGELVHRVPPLDAHAGHQDGHVVAGAGVEHPGGQPRHVDLRGQGGGEQAQTVCL
ncbi:hypothetical protein AYL99_11910 [Fonsecaea erecta]|uniref:Uncharacterized protein n=1 Tax=Fonsecaea erecta TaxID=1367422 RepID=A0A178Z261_9EURO|nr:hypothetical protein AYL99_11910 [Fonsecaea erecta]OAP53888.1 hypothetical protein AYL99_11910 [Fonsecaea erecta]